MILLVIYYIWIQWYVGEFDSWINAFMSFVSKKWYVIKGLISKKERARRRLALEEAAANEAKEQEREKEMRIKYEELKKERARLCGIGQHELVFDQSEYKYETDGSCKTIIPKKCLHCHLLVWEEAKESVCHIWENTECMRCGEKRNARTCEKCNGSGKVFSHGKCIGCSVCDIENGYPCRESSRYEENTCEDCCGVGKIYDKC